MEITTIEEAEQAIQKWLVENQHNAQRMKDEAANFHFEVDYPVSTQKRHRIIQPKEYPGLILLLTGVATATEHREELKNMEEHEKDAFYSEIRKDILFLGNTYDLNTDENNVVTQIQISHEFYLDTLTKTQLYKGLLLNHKTLLYFINKFNDKFGVPEAPKQQETIGDN